MYIYIHTYICIYIYIYVYICMYIPRGYQHHTNKIQTDGRLQPGRLGRRCRWDFVDTQLILFGYSVGILLVCCCFSLLLLLLLVLGGLLGGPWVVGGGGRGGVVVGIGGKRGGRGLGKPGPSSAPRLQPPQHPSRLRQCFAG